ncbi:MAG: hypothetical protein LBS40_08500, partial [Burkholderiales bacterium]|nr:hypothetical protein [Burkholderiales bacterium]
MEKSIANGSVRFGSALAGDPGYAKSVLRDRCSCDSRSFTRFAALLGAVFGKKSERHQKTSLLPCREAKHHEVRHYKKVGLSAFVAAMLCVGVTAQATTVTVNDVTDGSVAGKCTLRDAVAAVNTATAVNGCAAGDGSNDTITFDAGVFTTPTTIDVTASGEIAITRSLTINGLLDGNDAPLITLDGKSANRILNITGSGSVLTVSGLAFQKGSAASGDGGAINIPNGTVTVSNSTFEGNRANSYFGGAIYTYATANVSNSTFENNQASGNGGAIHAGTADVSNSTFKVNRAGGDGGAIYAMGGTANVSNSAFEGNQTSFGNGGAISATTANVSDSTFENNRVGSGGSFGGGAINAYGTVNVSDSAFEGNQASDDGGAINASTANVSNSTFKDNQSSGDGGAVRVGMYGGSLRASHLTLLDNSATTSGAAIYHQGIGNARIDNSLILSSTDLVDAPTLCAVGGAGSIGGSYNIEWVNGTDTTSCSNTNNVSGGSGAIGAIVETTLADNGG